MLDRDMHEHRILALRLAQEEARTHLARLSRELADLVAASEGSNADDEHDPEGATIAFERAQLEHAMTTTRDRLVHLDAALVRVDAGTFGVCERCGEPIPDGRLEARPWATECVPCAERRR